MRRKIVDFEQDEAGDWVALLSCLHRQHVRHQPPFQERRWVLSPEGRAGRIASDLDCPLCDRAELPDGLRLARSAGPFDADSIPPGLRQEHRVAEATWAVVRVLAGGVVLSLATDPPLTVPLGPGDRQPVPPGVPHVVRVNGPFRLAIDFLVAG